MQFQGYSDNYKLMNKIPYWRFAIIMALIIQFTVIFFAPCFAEDNTDVNTKRMVVLAKQRWQTVCGNINFSDSMLFERIIYLHPQPEEKFTDFQGKMLSKYLEINHSGWIKQFFKGDLLKCLENLVPTGYYLSKSGIEPSLLLYKAQCLQTEVSIQESFNVVLLTVKIDRLEQDKGVTAADVRDILANYTNIGDSEIMNFVGEYELSDTMKEGYIFSNNQGRQIYKISDWRSDVVGFVSPQGISFLLFKVDPDVLKTELGLSYDFNWLNKGLLESDGKTLVDRNFILDDLDKKK